MRPALSPKVAELQQKSVLVANLGAPEINRLGVELEHRGALRWYVRPYVNKQRRWERMVERLPRVGRLYRHTLGRRTPPPHLPLHKVVEAGMGSDFLSALVARQSWLQADRRRRWSHGLTLAAERAVAVTAARMVNGVDTVVASYGTGRYAFEAIQRLGGRAILSYPIAHNGFQAQLYEEEAALAPQFAEALPRIDLLPSEYTERLNAECELADRILVGSSFVRQSFIAMGIDARKLVVTPYGVDAERFAPRTQPRGDGVFRVLFVGQIGQRKGVSYLLQAYEHFRKPDSELHIVGHYVNGAHVYDRYRSSYRHTPNVLQADLPALFHQADAFVFPSLIEGMPLVVLEAMACGVPVIATAHGPADIVRDGIDGFIVPIRDADAITLRLEQLYRDRDLLARLGRNAREQALRYTWDHYAHTAADAVLEEFPRRTVNTQAELEQHSVERDVFRLSSLRTRS